MQVKGHTTGLIIAGHGSTENPDSSRSTRENAEAIRASGIFDEVRCAFWLEKPGYRDCLEEMVSEEIYLVPNFTAEGFYTKEVIPREFALTGRETCRDGKRIHYCDPLGLHPGMTQAILSRVDEITSAQAPDFGQTCLLVAGHGTPRHRHSRQVVLDQVERIRAAGIFGQCEAAFMEELPLIADWTKNSHFDNVVMVPYFMSDGLHVTQDIPELLRISGEDGDWKIPASLDGKRIWYSKSVGTSKALTGVILDMVRNYDPHKPFCSHCPPIE
jgi:sirohydrochlorin cobaltochelatase